MDVILFSLIFICMFGSVAYGKSETCENVTFDITSTIDLGVGANNVLLVGDVNNDKREDVLFEVNQMSLGFHGMTIYITASDGRPGSPIIVRTNNSWPRDRGTSFQKLANTPKEAIFISEDIGNSNLHVNYLAKNAPNPHFINMNSSGLDIGNLRQVGDFNDDGLLDMLMYYDSPKPTAELLFGKGGAQFYAPKVIGVDLAEKSVFQNGTSARLDRYFGPDNPVALAIGEQLHHDQASGQNVPSRLQVFVLGGDGKTLGYPQVECYIPNEMLSFIKNMAPIYDSYRILSHAPWYPVFVTSKSSDPALCQIEKISNGKAEFSTLGDVNGDGMDDIIWKSLVDHQIWFALSKDSVSPGKWKQGTIGVGEEVSNIASGFLNSDKYADLVLRTSSKLIYMSPRCIP
ncbi:hypothetical protein [Pseudomonas sp. LB3P58]